MKTLSSQAVAASTATVIRERYLVEIMTPAPMRLSTLGDVVWRGQNWSGNGVLVSKIQELAGGGQSASLTLPDADSLFTALVLSADIRGIAVEIFRLYGDAPFVEADAIQMFSGITDGCEIGGERVTIGLSTAGRARANAPRRYWAAPLANHIPPPGETLRWGGSELLLGIR